MHRRARFPAVRRQVGSLVGVLCSRRRLVVAIVRGLMTMVLRLVVGSMFGGWALPGPSALAAAPSTDRAEQAALAQPALATETNQSGRGDNGSGQSPGPGRGGPITDPGIGAFDARPPT